MEICVSSEGTYLAAVERFSTSEGDVLRVFDLKSGDRIATIRSNHCDTAAFSPDEKWLFTGVLKSESTSCSDVCDRDGAAVSSEGAGE